MVVPVEEAVALEAELVGLDGLHYLRGDILE